MRLATLIFLVLSMGAAASEQRVEVAKGWFANCYIPPTCVGRYAVTVDRQEVNSGPASISVSSNGSVPPEFGGVMQVASAEIYRGKRIRLSAPIKTADVQYWAGLWLRADGVDGRMLAFDNMHMSGRPVVGNRDWRNEYIVLDIPENANAISFGMYLVGSPGKAWLGPVHIEVVGLDVPRTQIQSFENSGAHATPRMPEQLQQPRNLDFAD